MKSLVASSLPISHGWARLIDAGIDPRTVMDAATRDIDNAHDPARLIRYRLDEQFRFPGGVDLQLCPRLDQHGRTRVCASAVCGNSFP